MMKVAEHTSPLHEELCTHFKYYWCKFFDYYTSEDFRAF